MPDGNPYLSTTIAPALAQPVSARTRWGNIFELAIHLAAVISIFALFILVVLRLKQFAEGGIFWLLIVVWYVIFFGSCRYLVPFYRRFFLNLRIRLIGDAIAYNNRGSERISTGDRTNAISDLEKAIRFDPNLAVAHFNLALARATEGQWNQTIQDVTRAIELDPTFARSYSLRAVALNWLVDIDQSIEDCNTAISLDPKLSEAYMNRGSAWLQKQDFPRAIADTTEAIRLAPRNADAYVVRAHVWLTQKEYDRAIADASQATRYNRSLSGPYVIRASAAMYKGNLDAAFQEVQRAVELNPNDLQAIAVRSGVNFERQDFESVIADCTFYIEREPRATNCFSTRGLAKHRLGRFAEALVDYDAAIQIGGETPAAAVAYNNRGYTLHALHDYGTAIRAFEHAMRLDANHPNAFKNLAWLLATCPSAEWRNGRRALELANRAHELTGWQQVAWFAILAAAYAETGDYPNAVKLQQQVVASGLPLSKSMEQSRLLHYIENKPWRQAEP